VNAGEVGQRTPAYTRKKKAYSALQQTLFKEAARDNSFMLLIPLGGLAAIIGAVLYRNHVENSQKKSE
jgi:hypothetical protein